MGIVAQFKESCLPSFAAKLPVMLMAFAPCVIPVFYNKRPRIVKQPYDVALQIGDAGIEYAIVADFRRPGCAS